MENKIEKFEALIKNAAEFTEKHDPFGGLSLTEIHCLLDGYERNKEVLLDAIMNTYYIAYRRGYNKAKKDLAKN